MLHHFRNFVKIQIIFLLKKSLGSYHDGTADGVSKNDSFALSCNASENYLMTSGIGVYQDNLLNNLKLSSCSILSLKRTISSSDRR